jgi:S1-C subfamily serine protease
MRIAYGFVPLGLLVLAAAPLAAQQQTPVSATAPAAPRPRLTDGNAAEMLQLVNDLRAREARLLRELETTPASDVAARRSIEQQLTSTARQAFAAMSVIEARCLNQRSDVPRGQIGVTINTDMEMRDGRVVGSMASIAAVEPGSPAAAAGLQAGDRLISIAGRDFTAGMPRIGDVLEPGRRITVRIARDGRERDVPVTVGAGAPRMDPACPEYERILQPLRMGGLARVWMQDTTDGAGNRIIVMRPTPNAVAPAPPTPPTAAASPTPPAPPAPPQAPGVFVYGITRGATSELAYYNGAQLRQLDDDWRGVLGIRSGTDGVLVNEVAPGSAAAAAGLRTGDVILSVDGTTATSPFVAVRLLSLSDREESRLRVIRARETRTVVLRRSADAPRE